MSHLSIDAASLKALSVAYLPEGAVLVVNQGRVIYRSALFSVTLNQFSVGGLCDVDKLRFAVSQLATKADAVTVDFTVGENPNYQESEESA